MQKGDAVNGAINENFDVFSKDIIPLVERALQRLLKRISVKILENFTYDQVFPNWKTMTEKCLRLVYLNTYNTNGREGKLRFVVVAVPIVKSTYYQYTIVLHT